MRAAAFALLAALLALPCAVAADGPHATDALGREIHLQAPAERIVALAPHIVENVFSAGAGGKLVGVVSFSDYPPQAGALPQVGSAFAWSLEAVVALRPDLVIVWESGNGLAGRTDLERLGFAVYVSEPRDLDDIAHDIRSYGALAGTTAQAEAAASAYEKRITDLRSRYAQARPLRTFYQIWNNPLQTINGEHMISHVLSLCGGENVFAELPGLAPRVNIEAVLEQDPDVIIASGMDRARPEWLDDWKRFPALRAVRSGALLYVPPDIIQRPTARIAEGAAELCAGMQRLRANAKHPE